MLNLMTDDIQRATTWSIALSVLMIAAGVIAIFIPTLASVAGTVVAGWLLVISRLLHAMFNWRAGSAGSVLWGILLSLMYGAVGAYLVLHPLHPCRPRRPCAPDQDD
jgi:uncharacterized membrane protein HdeD (DUF308 family)